MRKLHYYLVAGNVSYRDAEDNVFSVLVNTTIACDTPHVGAAQLAKAQQGLQMTLFNKLQEQVSVVDVTVINVCALGQMSPERFNAAPDGMKVQERLPGDDLIIGDEDEPDSGLNSVLSRVLAS